jgi:hypothetical protein
VVRRRRRGERGAGGRRAVGRAPGLPSEPSEGYEHEEFRTPRGARRRDPDPGLLPASRAGALRPGHALRCRGRERLPCGCRLPGGRDGACRGCDDGCGRRGMSGPRCRLPARCRLPDGRRGGCAGARRWCDDGCGCGRRLSGPRGKVSPRCRLPDGSRVPRGRRQVPGRQDALLRRRQAVLCAGNALPAGRCALPPGQALVAAGLRGPVVGVACRRAASGVPLRGREFGASRSAEVET